MSSLLARREAAISRNDTFLAQLGFHNSGYTSGTVLGQCKNTASTQDHHEDKRKNVQTEGEEHWEEYFYRADHIRSRKQHLNVLLTRLSYRSNEILDIISYLDPEFDAAPALLITGPPGCGKTEVCKEAVRNAVYPARCVYQLCSGFSSAKQLIKSLWHNIVTSCATQTVTLLHAAKLDLNRETGDNTAAASTLDASIVEELLRKSPGSFPDLVFALGKHFIIF
jgi:hypothetical protein